LGTLSLHQNIRQKDFEVTTNLP